MLIFPIACALGIALGYALGGRIRNLADLGLRAPALVALALLLQVGAGAVPEARRSAVVAASYALVAVWLAANALRRPIHLGVALALLAAGWALNLSAMAANGGMPVSLPAARQIGARPDVDVTEGKLFKHVAADQDTRLAWLGDVIAVRPLRSVISVGDIAMFAGIVLAVAGGMGPQLARRPLVGAGSRRAPPSGQAREALAE